MPIGPSKRVLEKVKAAPSKFSPEEQALRDLWNRQEFEADGTPKHPPLFRKKQPTIVGSELAQDAEKLFKIAPNLRGKASSVRFGPGGPSMNILRAFGMSPYQFDNSNLLGASNTDTGEININPGMGVSNLYEKFPPDVTLGHEFTHVAGHKNEVTPRLAEELMKKLKAVRK